MKQYLAQQEAILAQKKSEGMTDSSKSSKVLGLLLSLSLLLILLPLLAKIAQILTHLRSYVLQLAAETESQLMEIRRNSEVTKLLTNIYLAPAYYCICSMWTLGI